MTSTPHTPAAASDRFTRLEDAGRDFPYCNGAPTAISTAHWLFVLAMVVAGFLVLASPIDWPGGT